MKTYNNDKPEAKDGDEKPIVFTQKELHTAIEEYVQPLEAKAYAAGKRDGLAEAHGELRESTMVKAAQLTGHLPSHEARRGVGSAPTAVDLARRAGELQAAAAKTGKALSNIEAVKAAYKEANIPLR